MAPGYKSIARLLKLNDLKLVGFTFHNDSPAVCISNPKRTVADARCVIAEVE